MEEKSKIKPTKTVFEGALEIGDYNNWNQPPGDNDNSYKWTDNEVTKTTGTFFREELEDMLEKNGLSKTSVDRIAYIQKNMIQRNKSGQTQTLTSDFACAKDSDSNLMLDDNNYLAAPCPPYCGAVIDDDES